MLPGVGLPPATVAPTAFAARSTLATISKMRRATSSLRARRARTCSAPISSVVSERMVVPPASTTRSETTPTVGLEAIPEVASEPPHSVPTIRAETGVSTRCCTARRAASCWPSSTPRAMARTEPPAPSSAKPSTGLPGARARAARSTRSASPPASVTPDHHRRPDVGAAGGAGQDALRQGPRTRPLGAVVQQGQRHRARDEGGHPPGDGVRRRRRRHDQQVVADAHRPVRAGVAVERPRQGRPCLCSRAALSIGRPLFPRSRLLVLAVVAASPALALRRLPVRGDGPPDLLHEAPLRHRPQELHLVVDHRLGHRLHGEARRSGWGTRWPRSRPP